jgi:hypothetical protein
LYSSIISSPYRLPVSPVTRRANYSMKVRR